MKALETTPYVRTLIGLDGKILGIVGAMKLWEDRAEVFALLDQNCRDKFIVIHRVVKRLLDLSPFKRLEAAVDVHFEEGHRWIEMLGFKLESEKMHAYFPNGKDASLYARVR